MLKPLESKFCPDLSARVKDITKKQTPAKLKPIEGLTIILQGISNIECIKGIHFRMPFTHCSQNKPATYLSAAIFPRCFPAIATEDLS